MSLKLKTFTILRVLICCLIGSIAVAWYWYEKKAIVGFWGVSDGRVTLEFRNDGTWTNYCIGGISGRYSYRIVGHSNLKLEFSGMKTPVGTATVHFNIKRDVMVINFHDPIDVTTQLHRVDPSKTNALSPEEEINQLMNQRPTPDTNLFQRLGR